MRTFNLPREKNGEQTLPALPETFPLLPLPEAQAPGAQQPAAGGDAGDEEDDAAESPVMNPEAPVNSGSPMTPAPAAAADGIPQEEAQREQAEPAPGEEPQAQSPVAVATVTEDSVTLYHDGEAPKLLPAGGKSPRRMPVASATPDGGVRMPEAPESNGEYLTAGQVERLLHAAYMRGRNEAVAARIEADTSIRTLRQRDDVLFSTRPSVWERPQ